MQYTVWIIGRIETSEAEFKKQTYDKKLRMTKSEKKSVLMKQNCRNFCVTYNGILRHHPKCLTNFLGQTWPHVTTSNVVRSVGKRHVFCALFACIPAWSSIRTTLNYTRMIQPTSLPSWLSCRLELTRCRIAINGKWILHLWMAWTSFVDH